MVTPNWLTALGRIANGVMDAINRKNKKADVADTIAGDGSVHESDATFDSLSKGTKRNKPKRWWDLS